MSASPAEVDVVAPENQPVAPLGSYKFDKLIFYPQAFKSQYPLT